MEFTEHKSDNRISIDNYENQTIVINDIAYQGVLSLEGNELVNLPLESMAQLDEAYFTEALINREKPELILLGTGINQQFMHPKIVAFLSQQGIGIEVMATAPACRTFNILQSENRAAWAILFTA
jgi:uncharacterized protein